jgi:hypothetical protein
VCSTPAYSVRNGVGNIFGTGLLRTSLTRREDAPHRFHRIAARYSARRKRALLLAPVLVSLLALAVGPSREAISKVSRQMILAALQDPLSLFSDRSPGERRPGALLSTKKGGPHERVLSTVRERPQASDLPPGTETPIFPTAPPADQFAGPPAFGPPFSNTPFSYPGPPPPGLPPGGIPPGGIPPGGTPPGGPPPGGPPPGGPPPGGPPPGGPPETPPIPVPEPATWAIMLLGLLGIGAAMRLRATAVRQ